MHGQQQKRKGREAGEKESFLLLQLSLILEASEAVAADRRGCSPQLSPLDYLVHYLVSQHYVYSPCKSAIAVHTDTWKTVWMLVEIH